MNCERSRDLIVASVMDGLDEETSASLARHLEGCLECARELEELRSLWTQLAVAALPEPQADRSALVAEAIRVFRSEADFPAGAEDPSPPTRTDQPPNRLRPYYRIAASILLVASGAVLGAAWAGRGVVEPTPAEEMPTFLVLMRGEGRAPDVSNALDAWIDGLSAEERLVGGAQVAAADAAWFGPPPEPFAMEGVFELFGYMIIQATDADEAREIARGSPHIGARGAVEIWPIQ